MQLLSYKLIFETENKRLLPACANKKIRICFIICESGRFGASKVDFYGQQEISNNLD